MRARPGSWPTSGPQTRQAEEELRVWRRPRRSDRRMVGVHAECRREWAKSTETAGLASAEEVEAVRGLEQPAAAAAEGSKRGLRGPDMREAVAAWKEAVSAAGRAEEDGAAGRTGQRRMRHDAAARKPGMMLPARGRSAAGAARAPTAAGARQRRPSESVKWRGRGRAAWAAEARRQRARRSPYWPQWWRPLKPPMRRATTGGSRAPSSGAPLNSPIRRTKSPQRQTMRKGRYATAVHIRLHVHSRSYSAL